VIAMDRITEFLRKGEGLGIEFKRCSGEIEHDVFETICAFLNRFGGDILLGVENDGAVVGVKGDATALRNNIVNVVNDANVFDPPFYHDPRIVEYDGRTLIHVRVPVSGEMHAYKGVVYDRNGDADVCVRSVAAKSLMLMRKQRIFTERKIYPYVTKADLDLSDLQRMRIRAQNNTRGGRRHPWMDMDDDQLLRSAKLIGTDRETGKVGFNLAAVMLFGTQDVIKDVCPAYVTDALLRRVNVDRYDDRDIVDVNLIAAYDRLMDFARKHLPDPFFLEGDLRISLREIIVREMVSNVLIHREFTSSRPARFIIERDRMFVENACRATNGELVTPDTLEPDPKNPIIAAFFREIAYADQLGSGVKNLYKYAKAYGGSDPTLQDGDMLTIAVSLEKLKDLIAKGEDMVAPVVAAADSEVAPTDSQVAPTDSQVAPTGPEVAQKGAEVAQRIQQVAPTDAQLAQRRAEVAQRLVGKGRSDAIENTISVYAVLAVNGDMSIAEIESRTKLANRSIKNAFRLLRLNGVIAREGGTYGGKWVVLV